MAELDSEVCNRRVSDDGGSGINGNSLPLPSRMDVATRMLKEMHKLYDLDDVFGTAKELGWTQKL